MVPRLWNSFDRSENPFAELEALFASLDGSAPSTALVPLRAPLAPYFAPIDVQEHEDRFECFLDVPGVAREDLKLSLADDTLRIQGERPAAAVTEQQSRYFRRAERWAGSFSRTLTLPSTVDASRVEAQLKDGVLKLVLPKKEQAKARSIQIKDGR
jgi:HSP20 family protein